MFTRVARFLSRHWLLWLGFALASCPAQALEQDGLVALALRVQKSLASDLQLDATLTGRWADAFNTNERKIAQLSLTKSIGRNEFAAAYNVHFDRNGLTGKEHRLWQQVLHTTVFDKGELDSSARLEERYFAASELHGQRLRILNRFSHPLASGDLLRLGYEWVVNLNDIGSTTHRGVSQNRLLTSYQHRLENGTRLELEYQLRYLHVSGGVNGILHQLQLQYSLNL